MSNTILHKRSSTTGSAPTSGQLTLGELALNTADGKVFMKDSGGNVVEVSYRDARVDSHLSGGTGVTYSSGTISIGQAVGTTDSPTFAGLTLTSDLALTGDILPSADNTYSLGSASYMWKDVFVGPGSLYVNGQKVLEENAGTIVVSADANQNISVQTSGSGDVELDPTGTGVIALKGPVQIQAGSNVSSSDGNAISFASQIATDSLTSKSANTDLTITANGTGKVYINDAAEVSGNLVIGGNLTVSGTTTTVNSETISLADNIIDLNSNFTSGSPTENAGLRIMRGDESNVQVRWNESSDIWDFTNDGSTYNGIVGLANTQTLTNKTIAAGSNTISGLTNSNLSGSAGITNANLANSSVTVGTTAISLGASSTTLAGLTSVTSTGFTGALTGNASTATTLATARTISLTGDVTGSVSFDGSADAAITATIAANSVALGTDTTGNYVAAGAVSGNGLSGSASAEGATFTVTSNATNANTASTIVFRDASGNFSAGTITANLTGNVTGNVTGSSGSCTGNAATATSATSATNATNAANVATIATATNASHYLTFVDSNNGTSANELLYTDAGIYYNPSTNYLYVTGEVTAYASDARLKTEVTAIQNPLSKLEAIRGVTYKWNEKGQELGLGTAEQVGVIAQEIEEVLPQLVVESAHEGYKTVKYDKLTALLIEAVKELSAKVNHLQAQLDRSL